VWAEIEALKKDGPAESYTQKVREGQLRKHETDLEENPFWLGWLSYAYRHGIDPVEILAYPAMVETVTPARMREAAQRYLGGERYLLGVLYPEDGTPAGSD
jgi:zinc protease